MDCDCTSCEEPAVSTNSIGAIPGVDVDPYDNRPPWQTMSDDLKTLRDYFLCPSEVTPMGFESRRSSCCNDRCGTCGLTKRWRDCPVENLQSLLVTWREYGKVPDVKGNTREELVEVTRSADVFMIHFKKCVRKYLSHYLKYRWLNNIFKHDIETFGVNEIMIQTDFAAQMVMVSMRVRGEGGGESDGEGSK